MKKAQLVFIPSPGVGHLVSAIEFAKALLHRSNQALSITVLLIRHPYSPDLDNYGQSLISPTRDIINYINLPLVAPPPSEDPHKSIETFITNFIDGHKDHVRDAIANHVLPKSSVPIAGLVVDMFCSTILDVADELGVPSYVFFTSSVAFLGLMLYLPTRHDRVGTEFEETGPDEIVPSYANPVPRSVFPAFLFNKDGGYECMVNHSRRIKKANGVLVNSFAELEPHAVGSLLGGGGGDGHGAPEIYTVGPVLDLKGQDHVGPAGPGREEIMKWLDDQPAESVVFLCFGSMGSFNEDQLKEIALGLERSGHR